MAEECVCGICVLFEAHAENITEGGHQAFPRRSLYFLTLPTFPNCFTLQLGADQLPLQIVTHLEIKQNRYFPPPPHSCIF